MSPEVAALLVRLDEAHAASTPGEWEQDDTWTRWVDTDDGSLIAEAQSPADAAAIVALHNAWPALAAELRRQDAALKAVEAGLVREGGPYRCCPHCAEDVIHDVERDQHTLPCDVCIRAALAAGDDGQATT